MLTLHAFSPRLRSIQENFRRRERCADVIAEMKASALGLLWLHRDMDRGIRAAGETPRRAQLPQPSLRRGGLPGTSASSVAPPVAPGTAVYNAYVTLNECLASTRLFLLADDADVERINACHARAIRALSTLSLLNEVLGDAAGYSKGCEGGVSRAHQYTRFMVANLEQLRILRSYSGSPHGMRYFCALMTHISPLFLAPYFRHFCPVGDRGCAPGYFSAVLYGVVLTTLYTVSVDIEDLCDGRGLDDLVFNADVELREAAQLGPFEAAQTPPGAGAAPEPDPPVPPRPMPRVWVRYDDVLGRGCSGALVEAPSERLFAHRDPSLRLPRASAGGPPSAAVTPAQVALAPPPPPPLLPPRARPVHNWGDEAANGNGNGFGESSEEDEERGTTAAPVLSRTSSGRGSTAFAANLYAPRLSQLQDALPGARVERWEQPGPPRSASMRNASF